MSFLKSFMLVLVSFFALKAQGQDAAKDLSLVYQNYLKLNSFDMSVDLTYYETVASAIPFDREKNRIIRDGLNYYMSLENQEIVQGSNFVLVVDKEEKTIIYYTSSQNYPMNSADQYKALLEKTMKNAYSFVGEEKGIKKYSFKIGKDFIKTMEVGIDIKNSYLKQVIVYYDQTSVSSQEEEIPYKVVMDYTLNATAKPSASWFDISKYINISGGNISLKPAYIGYELITNEN